MSTKRTKPRPYLEQCLGGFLGLSSLPSQQVPEESIPAELGKSLQEATKQEEQVSGQARPARPTLPAQWPEGLLPLPGAAELAQHKSRKAPRSQMSLGPS